MKKGWNLLLLILSDNVTPPPPPPFNGLWDFGPVTPVGWLLTQQLASYAGPQSLCNRRFLATSLYNFLPNNCFMNFLLAQRVVS